MTGEKVEHSGRSIVVSDVMSTSLIVRVGLGAGPVMPNVALVVQADQASGRPAGIAKLVQHRVRSHWNGLILRLGQAVARSPRLDEVRDCRETLVLSSTAQVRDRGVIATVEGEHGYIGPTRRARQVDR